MAAGATYPVLEIFDLAGHNNVNYSFAVVTFMYGAMKAARQFMIRSRIESLFEKRGIDERLLAKTTDTWCDRQTILAVLKHTEQFAEYRRLCEERSSTALFKNIPHCIDFRRIDLYNVSPEVE